MTSAVTSSAGVPRALMSPGETPVTSTADTGPSIVVSDVETAGTDEPGRSDTLNTSGAVDGLIPVKVGNFTYLEEWTSGLTPSHGPTTGRTTISLSGPFIENTIGSVCFTEVDELSASVSARATTSGKLTPESLEIPLFDIDVYFDDVRATDARIVLDNRRNISIKAVTPAHRTGKADVTVAFHDLGCDRPNPTRTGTAALPEFPADTVVFSRADLFEFTDTAPVETTVTELDTVTETVTQEVPVSLDPTTVTVTSTPVGPQLAATGVDSSTLPKVLAGMVLFLAGTTVLALGRRPRAH